MSATVVAEGDAVACEDAACASNTSPVVSALAGNFAAESVVIGGLLFEADESLSDTTVASGAAEAVGVRSEAAGFGRVIAAETIAADEEAGCDGGKASVVDVTALRLAMVAGLLFGSKEPASDVAVTKVPAVLA